MTPLPDGFLTVPLAHRGYHNTTSGCVENSRAAFVAAINAGYGIELDVQLSSDGHAMVFHDYDMTRLTGNSGPIRMQTRDDLIKTVLTGCDETIPTLPEILTLINGRVPVLIEIKDQDGAMGPDVGPLESSVANALQSYVGPAAVMSFNPHAVAALAKATPNTPRGLVSGSFPADAWLLLNERTRSHLRDIPDYDRVGASFISHRFDDLDRRRVADLKAGGAALICWTIRSAADEIEARKLADTVTFEGYAAETP